MEIFNERIVYENDEGGISIIVPAPGATYDQCAKAIPLGKKTKIMNVSEIPSDRTFRNAWELSDD